MIANIQRSSSSILRDMKVGETRVLTERSHKNAGSPTTSYAYRAGVKVTTNKCLIVVPHKEELIAALLVTRVE